jgi:hypothetical protein
MSFDRFRTQVAIELELGCTDLQKWTYYNSKFISLKVNATLKEKLLNELKMDASDLYFKAIFSMADAIYGLYHGRHSWSLVKLYYVVFYLLRCSMATYGYAFVKNKGIYTIKLDVGEVPVRRDGGKYQGERVSGDHKTTIATYVSTFGSNDILQTNTIEGQLVYDWIMELRNQVNYRERTFQEPSQRNFYSTLFDKAQLKNQIETYINDDSFVYCFDKDHCCLAAPLKLAVSTRNELFNFIDFEPFDKDKKKEIERLLVDTGLTHLSAFKSIYDFDRS